MLTLLSAVQIHQPPEIAFAGDCAQLNAQAYQPLIGEAADAFQRAGSNTLGGDYWPLPQVKSGVGSVSYVNAFIPCVVLKAIGMVESGWSQASGSVPRGQTGPALTGYGATNCGYGTMQITSGMGYPGQLDPAIQRRIAEQYRYNIGWGAKMLADKWNWVGATMGDRDPRIAENWYFAVWAYNYWAFKNNPNNPSFKWPRPAYNPDDKTQDHRWYPYQELVWGWAAHPPDWDNGGAPWWGPVDLKLPNRDAMPPNITDPGVTTNIPDPAGVHADTCNPIPFGQVRIDRTLLAFLMSPDQAQSVPQTVTLSSTNDRPFNWQIGLSVNWLVLTALTPANNVTTAQFRVSAAQPIPTNRATGTLTVSASGSYLQSLAQQIPVSGYVGALQRFIFPIAFR